MNNKFPISSNPVCLKWVWLSVHTLMGGGHTQWLTPLLPCRGRHFMSVLSYDTFYLELHENIEQHPVQCQVLQSSPKPRFLWIHSGMLLAQHLSYIYKFIIKEDVYGFRVCISRMISTHVQTTSLPKYTKLQKINSDKTFPISFAKYAS